jgi:hypothetical protein
MSTEHIQTLYKEDLKPLEKLLSTNSENIWRERKAKSPESDFIVEL